MDTKALVRTQALARRDALAAETRQAKSAAICAELEQLACKLEERLHRKPQLESAETRRSARQPLRAAMYAPMRSEVDVVPFARAAYARGWEACFPCMVRDEPGQPARMVFFRVPAQRFDLAQKAFLSTPLRCFARTELMGDGCDEAAPETLDFVAVPLVAFDDRGNRLGYGGGNYDRLLPLLRPDACTAGVAFAEQRVDAVPTEPHDQLLARIVCA